MLMPLPVYTTRDAGSRSKTPQDTSQGRTLSASAVRPGGPPRVDIVAVVLDEVPVVLDDQVAV